MEALRTPDERFNNLKEYPFEPHYTNIKTHDRTTLRIHHIDETKGNSFSHAWSTSLELSLRKNDSFFS